MSLLPALGSIHNWRQFLLEDALDPGLAAVLPDFLKHTGQAFLDANPVEVSPAEHAALERWYVSAAGQGALTQFVASLWGQMYPLSSHAMPAHDARHAMFKVPATALEYMAAEKVQGWERVGVLGALLHDHGRWAEERIFGEPGESLVHARLSFLLGQELLEACDMPATVKRHILLAALRHTSGAHPSDPMPLKLTVSADRDQLYGPEIILRLAHHAPNAQGDQGSFYGEKRGKTVLDQLSKFLVCRLPGPLFSRQAHVDQLWSTLATFILLAEDADASRARFSQLSAHSGAFPAQWQPFDWEEQWQLANELRPRAKGPAQALMTLLEAPHVAPSTRYRQLALDKLSQLAPANAPLLASALAFAEEQRWAEDQRQALALARIARDNPSDRMVQLLVSLLLNRWNG